MRIILIVCFYWFGLTLSAQALTLALSATDATCSSNGTVSFQVTGGSGNYSYQLSNTCGGLFPPQPEATFGTLSPCDYSVTVTDRSTGRTVTQPFEIAGNDTPLNTTVTLDVCDVVVTADGGLGPYTLNYQIGGVEQAGIMFDDTTRIDPIGDQVFRGTVTDDCGNSRPVVLDGGLTAVRNYTFSRSDGNTIFSPVGGLGPFTYTVTSSAGSFTNTTGAFPDEQLGCDLSVMVAGACPNAPYVRGIVLRGSLQVLCVNLTTGTITVDVDPPGAAPYQYRVEYDGGAVNSDDPFITGIPTNATGVIVRAFDACGDVLSGGTPVSNNRPFVPSPADGCDDLSLPLTLGRTCGGEIRSPVSFTCVSCPGSPTLMLTDPAVPVIFPTIAEPGTNLVEIEDACGDRMTCTDTTLLELQPACDSLIATYIRRFSCDNGSLSRQVVIDEDFRYTLLDENLRPLVRNQVSSVFTGLSAGIYSVAISGDCVSDTSRVELSAGQPIDPPITVTPIFTPVAAERCSFRYRVSIGQGQGPYQLTSFSDPSLVIQLNDFGLQDCSNIELPLRLVPGRYLLTSLSLCGEKEFELPDLVDVRLEDLAVAEVCPGNSTITVRSQMRTIAQWRDFFASFGLNASLRGLVNDFLTVDGEKVRGMTRVSGIAAGDHVLGIHTGFSMENCPLDTIHFTIPEYRPVRLNVDGNVLCGATGEAPVRLTPLFGNAPYTLRQIDCANPRNVLRTFRVEAGESVDATTRIVGTYCYVVEDDCGVTSDFQVEVRRLVDRTSFVYECTPAVRLFSDTVPGTFRWFDDSGLVGTGNSITVPPSLDDRSYRLEVQTAYCLLDADLVVPGRVLIPDLTLDPNTLEVVQCDMDTVALAASSTNAVSVAWRGVEEETVSAFASIRTVEAGSYTAVATNDLGCTLEQSITVRRSASPRPVLSIGDSFCPGEAAPLFVSRAASSTVRWSPTDQTTDTIEVSQADRYFVAVTSVDGCTGLDSLDFTPPLPLALQATTDSLSCFESGDGVVTALGTGGTGQLIYLVEDMPYEMGTSATGLSAGRKLVQLQDDNGCTIDTMVSIGEPDPFLLDLGRDRTVSIGDVVRVEITSNQDDYTVLSTDPMMVPEEFNGRTIVFQAINTQRVGAVIVDEDGCTARDSLLITVDRSFPLYAPSAFSPNNDGVNDAFTIQGRANGIAAIETLIVFDRWGTMLYSRETANLNDFSEGWDGSYANGRVAPLGTYVWQARIRLIDGTLRELSGSVTLVR